MTHRLKELREGRARIAAEMRAILDGAEAEKRAPTPEEIQKHEALFDKTEEMRKLIGMEERQIELDRESAVKSDAEQRKDPAADKPAELRMQGFRSWLKGGNTGEGFPEFRALSVGTDVEGGFLVTPEQFVAQLIQAVDNQVFIRRRATKIPVPSAQSLGVPTLDADPADADWTTELQTGSEDSTMAFGKRVLTPHAFAKRIKVSNDLLRKSLLPAESIVMQRLAYKFGITEEKGFMTGSGSAQPLGVFTASADGIATSRDVSTGNSTSAITFDGLINAKYSVKAQYWARANWTFHRDTVKMITKLKDGDGQYLWRPSVREGEPDTVLGHPMDISEYAPNTFTTGLYVGLFGDMSFYWIADAMNMQMQRLNELYAETNQVGFIGRQEVDGMPVLGEAFARVTLA
ncbi:MAG: hypothetical protein Dbin4_02586 [Alphaproteobacteria bacterium]|nr:hypothetical protein [Alphaproteobacteria bacterium]